MADDKRPTCPRCRLGGYTQSPSPGDGRPMFTCSRCDHHWTNGTSGGEYVLKETSDGR